MVGKKRSGDLVVNVSMSNLGSNLGSRPCVYIQCITQVMISQERPL